MRFLYSPVEEAIAQGKTPVNEKMPVSEQVQHGIDFLERNRKDWAGVNPFFLKMGSCDACMCGHLFESFSTFIEYVTCDFNLLVKAFYLAFYLGFYSFGGEYYELQAEWTRRIRLARLAQLKAKEVTRV